MIQIKNLSRQIAPDFGLRNISFTLPENNILSLVGKSGSGKSTLMRCLAGLETCSTEVLQKPPGIGFVFQSSNLFTHLSLEQNIKLALFKVQKKNPAEADLICDEVLAMVQLSHRKHFMPQQLSGGQQQRGTIARALALRPRMLFYDEPTSSLDPELVDELLDLMLELKKSGITQIVATHEKSAIRKISDYVGYMNSGELKLFCPLSEASQKIKELNQDEQKYLQLFF